MSSKDRVLVYSDDPRDQAKMSGDADRLKFENEQKEILTQNKFTVVFRIEKNGRGGKTVTVLDQLPAIDSYLKDLTKELKAKCGVGGSYFIENAKGCIEIQGDKRDSIKKILESKKIKFKGV